MGHSIAQSPRHVVRPQLTLHHLHRTMFQRSRTAFVVASLFLAACLSAQQSMPASLTITERTLTSGGNATVNYSNTALAGQIVVIEVDNGMRRGTVTAFIEIQLDANGVGSAVWLVPAWMGANFNAPGVTEVHRVIT